MFGWLQCRLSSPHCLKFPVKGCFCVLSDSTWRIILLCLFKYEVTVYLTLELHWFQPKFYAFCAAFHQNYYCWYFLLLFLCVLVISCVFIVSGSIISNMYMYFFVAQSRALRLSGLVQWLAQMPVGFASWGLGLSSVWSLPLLLVSV